MASKRERTIGKQLQQSIEGILKGPDQGSLEGLIQGCLLAPPLDGRMDKIPYLIFGPIDEFEGAVFLGYLSFPQNYPDTPPDFTFITPNGVFEPNSGTPCVSIGRFHSSDYKRGTGLNGFIMSIYGIFTAPETLGRGIRVIYRKGKTQKISKDSVAYNIEHHPEILESFRETYPDFDLRQAVMHLSAMGKTPQEIHKAATESNLEFFRAVAPERAEEFAKAISGMPLRCAAEASDSGMASRRRKKRSEPAAQPSEPKADPVMDDLDKMFDEIL